MSWTKNTEKLLREVIKFYKEEPRRLDMGYWQKGRDPENPANPPCGSTSCIAGTRCILSGKTSIVQEDYGTSHEVIGESWAREAANIFGLTDNQASRLFRLDKNFTNDLNSDINKHWPKKFADAYNEAETPKKRLQVTVARINHFIKTKGRS